MSELDVSEDLITAICRLLSVVGEIDEDGNFHPLPHPSLSMSERERIAPFIEPEWRTLMNMVSPFPDSTDSALRNAIGQMAVEISRLRFDLEGRDHRCELGLCVGYKKACDEALRSEVIDECEACDGHGWIVVDSSTENELRQDVEDCEECK